jgi:hypothetical protein
VVVRSYREEDSVLNEEGELDNESDDSEFDVNEVKFRRRESNNSDSTSSSMIVEHDSSMIVDD